MGKVWDGIVLHMDDSAVSGRHYTPGRRNCGPVERVFTRRLIQYKGRTFPYTQNSGILWRMRFLSVPEFYRSPWFLKTIRYTWEQFTER